MLSRLSKTTSCASDTLSFNNLTILHFPPKPTCDSSRLYLDSSSTPRPAPFPCHGRSLRSSSHHDDQPIGIPSSLCPRLRHLAWLQSCSSMPKADSAPPFVKTASGPDARRVTNDRASWPLIFICHASQPAARLIFRSLSIRSSVSMVPPQREAPLGRPTCPMSAAPRPRPPVSQHQGLADTSPAPSGRCHCSSRPCSRNRPHRCQSAAQPPRGIF